MGDDMKTKEKKEKPTPHLCVCGNEPAVVRFRGKKAISCPNPERCAGNLRTQWHGSEEMAVVEWNSVVASFKGCKAVGTWH